MYIVLVVSCVLVVVLVESIYSVDSVLCML